ncbi:MAG TPA: PadR family transcriptional regulator, partial [Aggregatilineales bacterium]|nr:PadR family transcriptional regulator [Aggregatilineales bacterium]
MSDFMTDAELAILTIIAEKPIAGCDVQEVITERNVRMWTLIGVESLYYLIQKLEQQGLIVNIDEHPPDDHKLRMYRVTSAGIGVLQTAITDLLSSPHLLPRGLEIGLANLPVLNPAQAHHALKGYRDALQSRYEGSRRQHEVLSEHGSPFHILSMFEHHLALIEAEISWFDEWFTRWKSQVDWKTDQN